MASETASQRWSALDVFRGLAVVWMIQGHTFTALLRPSEHRGAWSELHALLHGLTAPMFLLGGGLAYGLVSFRSQRPVGLRFVRRAVLLLVLGYMLQLPKADFAELLQQRDLLAAAARVGPLQLIGVCLLVCEALRHAARSRLQLAAACTGACLAITFSAPLVWRVRASQGPLLLLGTWLDGYQGSLFPFFPWAVFFLMGPPLALGVMRGFDSPRTAAVALMLAGTLAAAGSYALFAHGYLLHDLYGDHEFWHTSPLYVSFRVGAVVCWLGALWLCDAAVQSLLHRASWAEPLFNALSKSSLVAYVAHLLMLYGSPFTLGLVHLGATLSLGEASAIAFGLTLLTSLIALTFQRVLGTSAARAAPVLRPGRPDW